MGRAYDSPEPTPLQSIWRQYVTKCDNIIQGTSNPYHCQNVQWCDSVYDRCPDVQWELRSTVTEDNVVKYRQTYQLATIVATTHFQWLLYRQTWNDLRPAIIAAPKLISFLQKLKCSIFQSSFLVKDASPMAQFSSNNTTIICHWHSSLFVYPGAGGVATTHHRDWF